MKEKGITVLSIIATALSLFAFGSTLYINWKTIQYKSWEK